MADEDATQDGRTKDMEAPEPPAHHDEAFAETTHEVVINGTAVRYQATAGRMILKEEEGKKQASFFFVSYARADTTDVSTRPIVFAFNGGPGSSSVWLHLGVLGPRRVLLNDEGLPHPPPGTLVDNEHSILDVADLVFVDPVSTGYSRAIPEEDAKKYHHFTRDIESVSEFIRLYLGRFGRWRSPKFLAGESYGTTRCAGVAGHLFDRHGMTFNGLLLVSAVLNFQTAGFDPDTKTFRRGNDLPYVLFLPTYAATAWHHGKLNDHYQAMSLTELLHEVEEWAARDYALALLEGTALESQTRSQIANRLALYTGLDADYIHRSDLRIEILRFCKELLREERLTVGRLDSRYTGVDRFGTGEAIENDPSLDALMGSYTATLNDYVRRELEYESDLPYEILTSRVQPWNYEDFKNAYVDVSETLRATMARNRFLEVFVASGYFDLATPHFATQYTLNHMGLTKHQHENVTVRYYDAGHMMYVHQPSLSALASDMRAFIAAATG